MKFSDELITDLREGVFVSEELDLSNEEISDTQAIELANAVNDNNNVKSLILRNCGISDIGAKAFASLTLDEIDLSQNNITYDAIAHLSSASFKSLILNGNPLGDSSMQMFTGNANMINLSIALCDITGKGLEILLQKCSLFNVKYLDVMGNNIADIGWNMLERTSIEVLNASQAGVTDDGAQLIAKHGLSLVKLNLTNNYVTSKGAIPLASSLNLSLLMLNGNNITDEAMPAFAANTSITELWLNNTHLTSQGIKILSDNIYLKKLSLEFNRKIDTTAVEFLEHMEREGINVIYDRVSLSNSRKREAVTFTFDDNGGFGFDDFDEQKTEEKSSKTAKMGSSSASSPGSSHPSRLTMV